MWASPFCFVQVVSIEEPELENKRSELVVKNAENKRQLQMIEDKVTLITLMFVLLLCIHCVVVK